MKHRIVILDFLDKQTQEKVNNFRRKTSTMSGKVRTDEEETLHKDKYCSSGDIKNWVLVLEEDNVVGLTAVFSRNITFQNQKVRLGGIGRVRVREDRRKIGLASEMMNEAMKQLKKIDVDVAYLCTNMNSFLVKFYEKYGFIKMTQPYTFLSKSRNRYVENEGMLCQVNSKKLFDEIIKDKAPFDIGIGNF